MFSKFWCWFESHPPKKSKSRWLFLRVNYYFWGKCLKTNCGWTIYSGEIDRVGGGVGVIRLGLSHLLLSMPGFWEHLLQYSLPFIKALGDLLEAEWAKEEAKSRDGKGTCGRGSLGRALFRCFGRWYAFLGIFTLLEECAFRIAQPIFMGEHIYHCQVTQLTCVPKSGGIHHHY